MMKNTRFKCFVELRLFSMVNTSKSPPVFLNNNDDDDYIPVNAYNYLFSNRSDLKKCKSYMRIL